MFYGGEEGGYSHILLDVGHRVVFRQEIVGHSELNRDLSGTNRCLDSGLVLLATPHLASFLVQQRRTLRKGRKVSDQT